MANVSYSEQVKEMFEVAVEKACLLVAKLHESIPPGEDKPELQVSKSNSKERKGALTKARLVYSLVVSARHLTCAVELMNTSRSILAVRSSLCSPKDHGQPLLSEPQ